MSNVQVLITRLDESIPLPRYAKGGDAGADIVSRIDITCHSVGENAESSDAIFLRFRPVSFLPLIVALIAARTI